jgi:hypothetical protein
MPIVANNNLQAGVFAISAGKTISISDVTDLTAITPEKLPTTVGVNRTRDGTNRMFLVISGKIAVKSIEKPYPTAGRSTASETAPRPIHISKSILKTGETLVDSNDLNRELHIQATVEVSLLLSVGFPYQLQTHRWQ